MGKRVQRIPSWPGVKRFTPTKAVYICADQLVTSSHFACEEAADHTFRLRRTPSRIDAKRGDHSLQADLSVLIRSARMGVNRDCRPRDDWMLSWNLGTRRSGATVLYTPASSHAYSSRVRVTTSRQSGQRVDAHIG